MASDVTTSTIVAVDGTASTNLPETITTATPTLSPPASSILHHTSADFAARSPALPVHLVQYDQTLPVLAVALTYNGQPYTVPDGAAVNIRLNKRDGHYVYNPALGVDDARTTAYIAVTQQMTTGAGDFFPILEVVIDGGIAGTAPLSLCIDRNPVPQDAVESSDEYKTAAQQATAAANSATNAASSATDAAESASSATAAAKTVSDQVDAIDTKAQEVKTSITNLETAISNADTAKTNLQAVVDSAGQVNSDINSAVTAANTAAENANAAAADASKAASDADTAADKANSATSAAETAEAARVKAEAARVAAENARASAESDRVTAENARVEAEKARQAASAEAVENCEAATNTLLEQVNRIAFSLNAEDGGLDIIIYEEVA